MEEFDLGFQNKYGVLLKRGFQGELQIFKNGKQLEEKEHQKLVSKYSVESQEESKKLVWKGVKGALKVLDPTSISNWADSYETITNPNASTFDKSLAIFSAIPALGKVGKTIRLARGESKAAKAMTKIEKAEKMLNKIPTGLKKVDKPVENFTGKLMDKVLSKKAYTPTSFTGSDTRDIYNLATKPINIINKAGDIKEQKDNGYDIYEALKIVNNEIKLPEKKQKKKQKNNLLKNALNIVGTNKKKYAFGGNVINNQSPEEALFQMIQNSEMSGIEAANDPLVMGTKALGGMATGAGMSTIMNNLNTDKLSMLFSQKPNINKMLPGAEVSRFAQGGYTGDDIEVEGDESFETPNGQFGEFKGPSHEQGGIPLGTKQGGVARNGELPEGSFIYPKRFKIKDPKTGKKESMADRASKRNKKEGNLSKMLEGTSDKILKNTLDRTKAKNQREDSFDKMQWHQNEMNKLSKSMGSMPGMQEMPGMEKQMFAGGGPITGQSFYKGWNRDKTKDPEMFNMLQKVTDNLGISLNLDDPNSVKTFQSAIGAKSDGSFGDSTYQSALKYSGGINPISGMAPKAPVPAIPQINQNNNIPGLAQFNSRNAALGNPFGTESYTGVEQDLSGSNNESSKLSELFNSASMPTLGDAMGIAGNAFQAYMPLKTTLDQRKGDTANINPYENYGDEALNTLNKNYEFLDYLKSEQLQEANLNRNGTIGRNNSSTRSLNTGRAMNLATDAQYNDVNNKIYQQYFQNQSGINDKISGVQLDIDGKKAGGEQYRDLSDRQDRDAFYNNLSKSYNNLGEGVSKTGKSVNELKTRGTTQELMNQLSNLVSVNAMTGKTTQKEGIEGNANTVSAQVSAFVKGLMPEAEYKKLTAEQIKNIEAQFLPQFAASNK